jgi:UDP-N-acetylglucosamine enolpyruvyl transferase
MSKFLINGPTRLSGEISVSGAKNSALKIIPASLLSEDKIIISNLPNIEDVSRSLELLEDLGGKITRGKNYCEIELSNLTKKELDPKFANKLRASICRPDASPLRRRSLSAPRWLRYRSWDQTNRPLSRGLSGNGSRD